MTHSQWSTSMGNGKRKRRKHGHVFDIKKMDFQNVEL
jgi:hypothetical protein